MGKQTQAKKTNATHILSLSRGLSLGVDNQVSLSSSSPLEEVGYSIGLTFWRGTPAMAVAVCGVTVERGLSPGVTGVTGDG